MGARGAKPVCNGAVVVVGWLDDLATARLKGGDTKIELGFSMSQAGNSGDPSGGTPFGDA